MDVDVAGRVRTEYRINANVGLAERCVFDRFHVFLAGVLGRAIPHFLFAGASALKMGEEANSEMMAARERMIARRFGGDNATRTGGVRRKKKNVHKTATSGECVRCVCGAYIHWIRTL